MKLIDTILFQRVCVSCDHAGEIKMRSEQRQWREMTIKIESIHLHQLLIEQTSLVTTLLCERTALSLSLSPHETRYVVIK